MMKKSKFEKMLERKKPCEREAYIYINEMALKRVEQILKDAGILKERSDNNGKIKQKG